MAQKRLTRRVIRVIILIISLIVLLIIIIGTIIPTPPIEEFNTYHELINKQGKELYLKYKDTFADAEFFRNEAFKEWQNQNTKCIIKRDYSESKRMILMAISFAEEADNNMKNNKKNNPADNALFHFKQEASIKYPVWNKWIQKAILYSKEKKTVVLLVDKFIHNCLVIENGVEVANFLVEIDTNYVIDNSYKGGLTSVEGCYYVTSKKTTPETPFYKSLYLNYLNKKDSIHLKNTHHNPDIPNLNILTERISIHGKGDKDYNQTDGNIALANEDMDKLYDWVKIGTRVIIVGSTRDITRNMVKNVD